MLFFRSIPEFHCGCQGDKRLNEFKLNRKVSKMSPLRSNFYLWTVVRFSAKTLSWLPATFSSSSTHSLWSSPSSKLPSHQKSNKSHQKHRKRLFFWPRASSSYSHQPWSSSSGGGFPSHTAGLLSACWVITHTGPLTCLKRVRNQNMT